MRPSGTTSTFTQASVVLSVSMCAVCELESAPGGTARRVDVGVVPPASLEGQPAHRHTLLLQGREGSQQLTIAALAAEAVLRAVVGLESSVRGRQHIHSLMQ